jgi:Tol biopolymer transport system component
MADIWLLNLATGEETNLTNTADRHEELPTWWAAHPELVFFTSSIEQGMGGSSNPSVVGLDGQGYRIIDPEHGGSFSLAPDGSAIAYGGGEATAWLYRWDTGPGVFDPAKFGFSIEKLFQPSFSPDSRYLAWEVAGDLRKDGSYALGLAVFDLELGTNTLMHVYSPAGGGMVPHYISWSPDGSWIAYVTFGEQPATGRASNLWVMRPDGSEETYIDSGLEPTWSPDGRSLAYIRATLDGELALRIIEAGVWQPMQIDDLPFPARPDFIMEWITP